MAEEAAKLLAAVQAWAGEALAQTAAPGPGEGATCGWCPVCQAVDRVRGTSPEVREHLATGVTSLLHGAASLLEAVAEHQRARASGDTSDPDRPPTA